MTHNDEDDNDERSEHWQYLGHEARILRIDNCPGLLKRHLHRRLAALQHIGEQRRKDRVRDLD